MVKISNEKSQRRLKKPDLNLTEWLDFAPKSKKLVQWWMSKNGCFMHREVIRRNRHSEMYFQRKTEKSQSSSLKVDTLTCKITNKNEAQSLTRNLNDKASTF